MPLPSNLRHSSEHRAALERIENRQTMRWRFTFPMDRLKLGDCGAMELLTLPKGATLVHSALMDWSNKLVLTVDVPGGRKQRLMIPAWVDAVCTGRAT